MEELVYEKTDERGRVIEGLAEIEQRAVELAGSLADRRTAHRVRNVAQSAAAQRSLLEQDWHLADAEAGKPRAA